MKISLATPDNAKNEQLVESVTHLINSVYEVAEDGIWKIGAKRTDSTEVAGCMSNGELGICYLAGKMVGAIRIQRIDNQLGEFGMLAVHPTARHQTIGLKLIQFAEDVSRANGCTKMQLEILVPKTWMHPNKEHLKTWYQRLEYKLEAKGDFASAYPQAVSMLATDCDFLVYRKPLGEK
jgi:ribosomal protein S18 acetylase RimI-like enzyme